MRVNLVILFTLDRVFILSSCIFMGLQVSHFPAIICTYTAIICTYTQVSSAAPLKKGGYAMLIQERLERCELSVSERAVADFILKEKMNIRDMTTRRSPKPPSPPHPPWCASPTR